jgi:hypothetical protein
MAGFIKNIGSAFIRATGSEINTGTEDSTVVTPEAIGDSELVFEDKEQTLTNKTLTTPVISEIQAGTKFGLVVTPIVQRAHIADPSGGATQDSEARSAINSILATLEAFGFHLTS